MQATLLAFVTFFGWGIGNLLVSSVYKKLNFYRAIFYLLVTRLIISTVFVPFYLSNLGNLNFSLLILNLVLALAFIVGAIAESKAISKGTVSLNGALIAAFPLVSVLISLVFLGEKMNLSEMVAVVLIFCGIVLSSLKFAELKKVSLHEPSILFALVAMLGFGTYFGFIKLLVIPLGWFIPGYLTLVLSPGLFYFAKKQKQKLKLSRKLILLVVISGLFLQTADFSFNYAVGKGFVSIVAPIAGSASTLFVVLAYFVFKERLSKQQVIGIATTLVGVTLLAVFGSK